METASQNVHISLHYYHPQEWVPFSEKTCQPAFVGGARCNHPFLLGQCPPLAFRRIRQGGPSLRRGGSPPYVGNLPPLILFYTTLIV
jgi:hypothetical protein